MMERRDIKDSYPFRARTDIKRCRFISVTGIIISNVGRRGETQAAVLYDALFIASLVASNKSFRYEKAKEKKRIVVILNVRPSSYSRVRFLLLF